MRPAPKKLKPQRGFNITSGSTAVKPPYPSEGADCTAGNPVLTAMSHPGTLRTQGSCSNHGNHRKAFTDPQRAARIRDPQDRGGGQGLCRRHAQVAGTHRIRDPGRDPVSPPQQAAARGTRGLRVAGVGSRPAPQVLQAHAEGPFATDDAERILEKP